MRTLRLVAAGFLALAAAAAFAQGERGPRVLRPTADPSAVIATELAFAREAREKGTWTAFRKYATKDAVWPGPKWESVQAALKGQADPPQPIAWEPDRIWSSCDGSFALSSGPATQPNGKRSRFATIWQRQDKGEYRWVLDQGFDLEDGYAAPEMIGARVADCPQRTGRIDYLGRGKRKLPDARRGEAWQAGKSDDGTLEWATELRADCSRTLVVNAIHEGKMTEVFRRASPAPRVPEGAAPPTC